MDQKAAEQGIRNLSTFTFQQFGEVSETGLFRCKAPPG
ncbi:hypothetical protein GPLA_1709 [Paraglaciecola polaris LMG 21857]|uniref:Uncharacterized protein n=1 Tax=Paraglaciecola polaris LMG 21857 TaxID=1129793 RepID=K6ZQR3_9ALTE|nr:hypothetical protein GPLA_1709 [Paraglaciecola polaris LMG 21857]